MAPWNPPERWATPPLAIKLVIFTGTREDIYMVDKKSSRPVRRVATLFICVFLVYGCSQSEELNRFRSGDHELTLYEVNGWDLSSFPAWGISCKVDCGIFDDERTIYYIEIFTLDSLSIVFPTINTVVITPFDDGELVSEYSCSINLDSINCGYKNGCDYLRP